MRVSESSIANLTWKLVALANRTVTVTTNNDKTGYSLTAGSYSIRASSTQRQVTSAASVNADVTFSSVTTTRATEGYACATQNTTNAPTHQTMQQSMQLNTSTTVRFVVATLQNNQQAAATLTEFF